MRERFLLSVDPHRIRFNPRNPRKHTGYELDRLRDSIQRFGILQPPIVRSLPGNLYETIDGEGRTFIALEMGWKEIQVLDIGSVNADEALLLLQVSNSIRTYNLLAECKGFAHLHRQQMQMKELAREFKYTPGKMQEMVHIGYLPDDIHSAIEHHMTAAEEHARVWTQALLTSMLELREVIPGQTNHHGNVWVSLDGIYDYTEVRRALQEVLQGKIRTAEEMKTYVAHRRYEIYQARFDTLLAQRLEEELACAKEELEVAKRKEQQEREAEKNEQVLVARLQLRDQYEGVIHSLEAQLESLKKTYERTKKEVAQKPEHIKKQEQELQEELEKTQLARNELRATQQRVQEEAQLARLKQEQEQRMERERWEAERKSQLLVDLKVQRAKQEDILQQEKQKLELSEKQLKLMYEQKDQESQIKAENTIRGLLSHAIQQLAETQQIIDHLVSSSMLQPVRELGGAQQESLLWALRSLSESLDRAEQKLVDGNLNAVVAGHGPNFVEGGYVDGYRQTSEHNSK